PGRRGATSTRAGCARGRTASLFASGATVGAADSGTAPGPYLGAARRTVSPIQTLQGLLLPGGGPMGLAAVPGAVRYLEDRKVGFDWGIRDVRVPIVVGAVIDDLALGDGRIRPDADAAYKACPAATAAPPEEGNGGGGAGGSR